MKICIYHNDIHNYETIGYILEYCGYYNLEVHIYNSIYDTDRICNSNYEWYKTFFTGLNILILTDKPIDTNYDVIFLFQYKNLSYRTLDYNLNNIISIEHYGDEKGNNNIVNKIGTRKFVDRPEIPFAYPFYNIVSKYNKVEKVKNHERVRVLFVGKFNIPTSLTFSYFDNFENIDFYIVRTEKGENCFEYLEKTTNMFFYEGVDCELLINLMIDSHYVFFNDSVMHGYNSFFLNETLHLAFSTLTKCIIPESWNRNLNLQSVLVYSDDEFLKPNQQLKVSIEDFNNSLSSIVDERRYYISARNKVLDDMIKTITSIEPITNIGNKSWFSTTLQSLSIKKPKVFVETGTYIGNGILSVYNDFREIYSIDIKKEFIDMVEYIFSESNKVFLYEGDSSLVLEKLSKIIQEPSIFYLDAHYSGGETAFGIDGDNGCPVLRELQILNSRTFNDIIVIDDMRLMGKKETSGIEGSEYPPTVFDFRHVTMEAIFSVYTRHCDYYDCINGKDRLILIPV